MSIFSKILLILVLSHPNAVDSDGDGFPDSTELLRPSEQLSFRKWFVWIAIQTASGKMSSIQVKDCASFVSACYREALKRHDRLWAKEHGVKQLPPFSDARRYYYPDVPVLGQLIFRKRPPPFTGEIKSEFSASATGEYLVKYNLSFVGKELENAIPGDILAFYHPTSDMPYHLMIFFRYNGKPMVVYHTGPEGRFKILPVSALSHYPDASWRPVRSNTSFLGVFRWKILE